MKRQPILFSTGRFIDLNCMKRILSLWGIYDMHKRAWFKSTAFGDRPAYVDTSVPFQERTNTMCDYLLKLWLKDACHFITLKKLHSDVAFTHKSTLLTVQHTREWIDNERKHVARLKNGNRDHHLCLPAVVDLSCRMTVGKQALKIVMVI